MVQCLINLDDWWNKKSNNYNNCNYILKYKISRLYRLYSHCPTHSHSSKKHHPLCSYPHMSFPSKSGQKLKICYSAEQSMTISHLLLQKKTLTGVPFILTLSWIYIQYNKQERYFASKLHPVYKLITTINLHHRQVHPLQCPVHRKCLNKHISNANGMSRRKIPFA
jgi:hypothetical protein